MSDTGNGDAAQQPIKFTDLPLSEKMFAALEKAGYTEPTPVQAGLIPRALEGTDIQAQARTGTGKTASFVIPILEMLLPRKEAGGPQALVLVPTRELAVQVQGEFDKLSAGRRVSTVALYGGKPLRGQIQKLERGADVIVGTPGRLLDHMGRGSLRTDTLRIVVMDEADRMLDIGFRPDIEKILRRCPKERQTLLLSATVPPPVERLADRYMNNAQKLDYSPGDVAVDTIDQYYFSVVPERKFELLVRLLEREQPTQGIIFCRTKRGTESIYQRLTKKLQDVGAIHGDLPQRNRDKVMARFRENQIRFLVATDVVGRGIDVSGISHIINYDIPQFCDDYVHRVGRTGRMGREGVAYTFVSPEQGPELTRIEVRINRLLTRDEMEGFDAASTVKQKALPTDGSSSSEPEPAKPAPKPVFGRRTKRHRRAL